MRWVVGLILVCAAVLKVVQLSIDPAAALADDHARWLVPIQVGLELGFGLLILSGLYWRHLRWMAFLLFSVFAAYSLHMAVSGATSCGCFGPVTINPWWTFLLDLAVIGGLLTAIFRHHPSAVPPQPASAWFHRPALAVTMVSISILTAALLMRQGSLRTATASELLTTAGDLTISNPKNWLGKPLPIADAIDFDLSRGDWIVLLHRHDCPDCQEAVPRYEALAQSQAVLLVEVPPFPEAADSPSGPAHRARLSNSREWFVQTPVELRLRDGIVLAVKSGHGD